MISPPALSPGYTPALTPSSRPVRAGRLGAQRNRPHPQTHPPAADRAPTSWRRPFLGTQTAPIAITCKGITTWTPPTHTRCLTKARTPVSRARPGDEKTTSPPDLSAAVEDKKPPGSKFRAAPHFKSPCARPRAPVCFQGSLSRLPSASSQPTAPRPRTAISGSAPEVPPQQAGPQVTCSRLCTVAFCNAQDISPDHTPPERIEVPHATRV